MAHDTLETFKDLMIYEVFARAYSEDKGKRFVAIKEDLPRIKSLGINVLWLMPIHPTGEKDRKGTLGSPYAIKDYYSIDPSIGSEEDFKDLVKMAHEMKIKVIMDMVLNHCATDSPLVKKHPEWFIRDEDGKPSRKVDDWSDVYDFDYSNPEVMEYMLKMMKYWVKEFDIDGFRCDVAGLVPLVFWLRSRRELSELKPNIIWISETHDAHMYEAFDITYDYDGYYKFKDFLLGKGTLREYLQFVEFQDRLYPSNYIKMRFLENHDQERIAKLVEDEALLRNLVVWLFTLKGVPLVYNGQEYGLKEKPDIFNTYIIPWSEGKKEIFDFYMRVAHFRSSSYVVRHGNFKLLVNDCPNHVISYCAFIDRRFILFVLNLSGGEKEVHVDLSEFTQNVWFHAYNPLSEETVRLRIDGNGKAKVILSKEPLIASGYLR